MTASCTWRYSRKITPFRYKTWMVGKPRRKLWVVRTNIAEFVRVHSIKRYGTGKGGRIWTENLHRESNRNGSRDEILASMCENIGVIFVKSPNLSERVCNPCARKIRNFWKLLANIFLGIPENNLKWCHVSET